MERDGGVEVVTGRAMVTRRREEHGGVGGNAIWRQSGAVAWISGSEEARRLGEDWKVVAWRWRGGGVAVAWWLRAGGAAVA